MALGRVRQGVRALLAWTKTVDDDLAASFLSPPLLALFRQMRRNEQLHSLNVLRTLSRQGQDDPALMVAALLHDVGKSRAPFHLWDRVIVVLAKAIVPDRVRAWGSAPQPPVGWRRPFAVSIQHPRWSADMVAAAGADPLVVELIAIHQQHLEHPPRTRLEHLLTALQAADDAN